MGAVRTTLLATLVLLTLTGAGCRRGPERTRGEGGELRSFILTNVEDGKRYCQVCRNNGRPLLMAVADLDDPGIEQDLTQIQSLVDQNAAQGFRAFVVFGRLAEGRLGPVATEDQALIKLKALRERLALSFPLGLVPSTYTPEESRDFAPFADGYQIDASRTVLVAGIDRKVVYADVLRGDAAQYQRLAEMVKKTL